MCIFNLLNNAPLSRSDHYIISVSLDLLLFLLFILTMLIYHFFSFLSWSLNFSSLYFDLLSLLSFFISSLFLYLFSLSLSLLSLSLSLLFFFISHYFSLFDLPLLSILISHFFFVFSHFFSLSWSLTYLYPCSSLSLYHSMSYFRCRKRWYGFPVILWMMTVYVNCLVVYLYFSLPLS